ncbi:ISAs1 family transposase [Streptomyces arboris]|uniref:ISAs1 family transposase n=1 Tax=Streptomyces arboris TaxID=2600619 RepID=UPI003BF53CBC
MDGDALDAAIGAFLSARTAPAREADVLRPVGVDGKTVRGSRTRTTVAISLLSAMAHSGEVLAQRQVAVKSNEIPSFAPLLNGVDLTHAVITADALHTQHGHGAYLRSRGAHYIAVVKKNHPGLFDRVRTLPWREITLDHYERTRAHHRDEIRRLKTAAFAHLDYPDARQALQVVRWRRDLETGKLTIERVYLITSLPPGAATGAQLASWIRGHWGIENLLHHVRDRTLREDDSKIRTAGLPRTMASLRNWPSAATGKTARRTSQPPSGKLPATTAGPWPSSASPDETGQDHFMQRPCPERADESRHSPSTPRLSQRPTAIDSRSSLAFRSL